MKNKKYVTFQIRRSILRGMLFALIFVSMVDHAVTLIYDPDGRVERAKKRAFTQGILSARNPAACELAPVIKK